MLDGSPLENYFTLGLFTMSFTVLRAYLNPAEKRKDLSHKQPTNGTLFSSITIRTSY